MEEILLTLQSKAYLLASIIATFLSLIDSKASMKERPLLACQKSDWAAALPPPLTPHNCRQTTSKSTHRLGANSIFQVTKTNYWLGQANKKFHLHRSGIWFLSLCTPPFAKFYPQLTDMKCVNRFRGMIMPVHLNHHNLGRNTARWSNVRICQMAVKP